VRTRRAAGIGRIGRSLALVGATALAWALVGLPWTAPLQAASAPAVAELLKALELGGYAPGEKPPEFSARTPDGQTVSLAGLRRRVILVTFWATWCPPCKEDMPVFEQFHREFAAQGLSVVGINVGEGAPAIRAYAREVGLTFPLVLDPEGKIQVRYGVMGLPTTFLVGRDGRAVARAIGPREWGGTPARALIQALLAEPGARKPVR
jgi:peroxiredoxin